MQNSLRDAIKQKQRRSIDFSIVIGGGNHPPLPEDPVQNEGPEDVEMRNKEEEQKLYEQLKKQEKGSDLAPPREESMADSRESAKMEAKDGGSMESGPDEKVLDELMNSGDKNYEGKPRSLFERASMERKQNKSKGY